MVWELESMMTYYNINMWENLFIYSWKKLFKNWKALNSYLDQEKVKKKIVNGEMEVWHPVWDA